MFHQCYKVFQNCFISVSKMSQSCLIELKSSQLPEHKEGLFYFNPIIPRRFNYQFFLIVVRGGVCVLIITLFPKSKKVYKPGLHFKFWKGCGDCDSMTEGIGFVSAKYIFVLLHSFGILKDR